MAGPFLAREYELAVQREATYGASPGALAGADFFKHTSLPLVGREIERYYRDRDRDNGQASVLSVQKGREKSKLSIEADLIPSGNATTPTEPDVDLLIESGFGSKHKATAHTVTIAGSVGVALNVAVGGGAASGLAAKDFIAVDVDGLGGYEVRQVVSVAGDVITIDRAFTTDPAAARTVKVGTTYKLLSTALLSCYLWRFNNDNLRYAVPGVCIQELEIALNYAEGTPVGKIKFSAEGRQQVTASTTRPTPATAGQPLVPTVGKLWIGAVKLNMINAAFTLNNGIELRSRESDALTPNGLKRTGNNSRYSCKQTIEFYAFDTAPNTKTYYDAAPSLGGLDVLVQHGVTPGSIVAWRTPHYVPDIEETEQEGEIGYKLDGRALGTINEDEIFLGFI
jgi:hypothetical protein